MNNMEVIQGVTDSHIKLLIERFQLKIKSYNKQELIANSSNDPNMIGIMISGMAYLTTINLDYQKRILDYYEANDIFLNSTMLSLWNTSCGIYAKTRCAVIFLDYRELLADNSDALMHIQKEILVNSTKKTVQHIEILSQLTLRNKLISYFDFCKRKYNASSFVLPLSFSDLAEYLAVDRSAMMREIGRMKEENIIHTTRRNITLFER